MEGSQRLLPVTCPLISLEVQCQPSLYRLLCSHPIDRVLYLPQSAVGTLYRVGGRRQKPVVQERQSFLKVGRMQFVQTLAQVPVTSDTLAQMRELGQGRVRPTAPVKQAIDFVHDGA